MRKMPAVYFFALPPRDSIVNVYTYTYVYMTHTSRTSAGAKKDATTRGEISRGQISHEHELLVDERGARRKRVLH